MSSLPQRSKAAEKRQVEFEVPRLLFPCPFSQHVHNVTQGKGVASRFIVPSLYSQNLMPCNMASALGCCCPVGTGLQDLFLKWLLDSTARHCSHHGHALFHVTDSCYLWLEGLIQEPATAGFTYWVVHGKTTFLSTSSILASVEAHPKSCVPQGPQRPLDPACHLPCAANYNSPTCFSQTHKLGEPEQLWSCLSLPPGGFHELQHFNSSEVPYL